MSSDDEPLSKKFASKSHTTKRSDRVVHPPIRRIVEPSTDLSSPEPSRERTPEPTTKSTVEPSAETLVVSTASVRSPSSLFSGSPSPEAQILPDATLSNALRSTNLESVVPESPLAALDHSTHTTGSLDSGL